MNPTNYIQQVAEIELIYKKPTVDNGLVKVSSSEEVYRVIRPFYTENTIELREEFKVMLLDRGSHVLGVVPIAIGSTVGCLIDLKFILVAAVKANASGVILSHNHPSGVLTPSRPDLEITKKIQSALKLVDIPLIDHLIISAENYYSFADNNNL